MCVNRKKRKPCKPTFLLMESTQSNAIRQFVMGITPILRFLLKAYNENLELKGLPLCGDTYFLMPDQAARLY